MTRPGKTSPTSRPSGQTLLLASVVAVACLLVGYLLVFHVPTVAGGRSEGAGELTLADIPFNGTRAFEYLGELCAMGPRTSGTAGMQTQQKMLTEHFQKL